MLKSHISTSTSTSTSSTPRLPPVAPPTTTKRSLVAARPSSSSSSRASFQSQRSTASAAFSVAAHFKAQAAEARSIREKQMSGAAVMMAMKPSRGLRDDIVYAGGTPKDHLKENYKKLKDLQNAKRKEEQEKSKPPPAPFKLKRFENVKSKLSTHRPHSSNASDASESRPSTAKSSSSANSISGLSTASSSRNFIHLNAQKAKEPQRQKISSSTDSIEPKRPTKMGELPKYLVDRKMEWAEREKERLDALKKECIPKGMKREKPLTSSMNLNLRLSTVLPEEERLETLTFLQETQQKLLNELSHFGLVVESAKLKNKRSMVENKLNEIEEAIAVFSRRKVYVNDEDAAEKEDR
ncbi:hypothetical protein BCR33DRAFT_849654 [Rhizoclosmatium globosum]|uniref:Enkurin domain-containing protein n=1 Tax=Rhizoclosmatium globosum TaxID=329046 RepID=A0A1Y2CG91_9FUNG|nr:hypothetical protein BCR33DRAFT_849654 [Rhizoclosmatium globosum]|eukprot:ORY46022.1 hypothetical protein BCR33DRAFT_849654 [Rhizoclosmatium globosum]